MTGILGGTNRDSIAVITPSHPDRGDLLAEACASVAWQTTAPDEHLIGVDYAGVGPAAIRNRLMNSTLCRWVAFLDDDDLLDRNHLTVLLAAATQGGGADVVISHCRFTGEPIPPKYCNPRRFDRATLAKHGVFPITVLARRAAIMDAGAFLPGDRYEDWTLWNRMADAGGRFVVVPRTTWTYRREGWPNRTDGTL